VDVNLPSSNPKLQASNVGGRWSAAMMAATQCALVVLHEYRGQAAELVADWQVAWEEATVQKVLASWMTVLRNNLGLSELLVPYGHRWRVICPSSLWREHITFPY